jgi:membrane-associated phospholipid phosphatase
LKNLIPEINPFAWDEAFMQLDRTLHFGALPHEFLHAVFGGHYMISLFTGLYNIWLFMMYFVLVMACFMRPDSAVRMQYLIAFLFTWAIGGNLFATLFSSAGPVYYADLGLGDAYASLMQRLHDHAATGALTVVDTQYLLWEMYSRPELINAISAFPSMHVGSSVLMAIFAWRVSRMAGYLAWTFALLIMIGSVLLAWHYAVDGYVGGLVAGFSWFLAGLIVRARSEDFSPVRS